MREPSRKAAALPSSGALKEIEFDYIKSNFFRVVRSDGVFGGLAPSGAIHMSFYSERQPIPQKIFHSVIDGHLGPELVERREARKGILREAEVDVTLDIAQAMTLRTWLDEKIKQYEEVAGPLPTIPIATQVIVGGQGSRDKRTRR